MGAEQLHMLDVFKQFDIDGNGVVSRKEFRQAMGSICGEMSAHDINSVIALIDRDGNDQVCSLLSSYTLKCSLQVDYYEFSRMLHNSPVGQTVEPSTPDNRQVENPVTPSSLIQLAFDDEEPTSSDPERDRKLQDGLKQFRKMRKKKQSSSLSTGAGNEDILSDDGLSDTVSVTAPTTGSNVDHVADLTARLQEAELGWEAANQEVSAITERLTYAEKESALYKQQLAEYATNASSVVKKWQDANNILREESEQATKKFESEKALLEQDIAARDHQIRELSDTVDQVRVELAAVQNPTTSSVALQQALHDANQQVIEAKSQIDDLSGIKEQLQQALRSKAEEVSTLQTKLEARTETTNASSLQELSQLRQELSQLRQDLSLAQTERDNIGKRFNELLAEVSTKTQLQAEVVTPSKELARLNSKIDQLTQDLQEQSAEMDSLQSEYGAASKQLEETMRRSAHLEAQVKGHEEAAGRVSEASSKIELCELRTKLSRAEAERDSYRGRFEELMSAVSNKTRHQGTVGTPSKELAQLKAEVARLEDALEEQISSQSQLQSQLDDSSAIINDKSGQVEHLKAQLRSQEDAVASSQQSISLLQSQMAGFKQDMLDKSAAVKELDSENTQLQEQLRAKARNVQELQEALNEQSARAVESLSGDERRQQELQQLTDELGLLRSQLKDAEAKLQEHTSLRDELALKQVSLDHENKTLQAQLSSAQEERDNALQREQLALLESDKAASLTDAAQVRVDELTNRLEDQTRELAYYNGMKAQVEI